LKPLIYISGPYTKPDPVENTHKAIQIAEEIIRLGCTPYIPHLNLLWHLVYPHPIDFWYEMDIDILPRCDAVLRLSGDSRGADTEILLAQQLSIPIFYFLDELKSWKIQIGLKN